MKVLNLIWMSGIVVWLFVSAGFAANAPLCSSHGKTPAEIFYNAVAFFPGYSADKIDSSLSIPSAELSEKQKNAMNCIKFAIENNKNHLNLSNYIPEYSDAPPLLHQTIRRGDVILTKLLMDQGADLFAMDPTLGESPLNLAVRFDHLQIVTLFLDRIMLDKKRTLLQKIGEGLSPIHFAALNGNIEIFERLVKFGFSLNELIIENPYASFFEESPVMKAGMTPLDIAEARFKQVKTESEREKFQKIILWMKSKGAKTSAEMPIYLNNTHQNSTDCR